MNVMKTLTRYMSKLPLAKLSALSQLIIFFTDHLQKFPGSIRDTLYAVLVGTPSTNKYGAGELSVHDSNRPLEILVAMLFRAQEEYITEHSFVILIQRLAQIHSAYWRSNSAFDKTAKSQTLWIPEMKMQKLCTGHADAFSVLAPFAHLKYASRISIDAANHLISDIFAPCLVALLYLSMTGVELDLLWFPGERIM